MSRISIIIGIKQEQCVLPQKRTKTRHPQCKGRMQAKKSMTPEEKENLDKLEKQFSTYIHKHNEGT